MRSLVFALLIATIAAATGCHRSYYRRQADNEAYELIRQKGDHPHWALPNVSISPDPRSRMFDPTCPDCPPLPPDDPYAHELMHCVDHKRGYPGWHDNGETPYTENPAWPEYLEFSADGVMQPRLAMDSEKPVRTLNGHVEASADGAWHADNVAPCLLGGIVFIRSNEELDIAQIPVPKNLWAAVVHPDIEILTKVAREILPQEIPLANATQQIGNLGGLLCGLIQEDYGLISRSIHDVIAEPRRQKLIPEFYKAKRAALSAGALGFSISGAGPSVFALCEGEETARKVGEAVAKVFSAVPLSNQIHVSQINPRGVHVIDEKINA